MGWKNDANWRNQRARTSKGMGNRAIGGWRDRQSSENDGEAVIG